MSLLAGVALLHAQGGPVVRFAESPDRRIDISPVGDPDYYTVAFQLGRYAPSLSSASFFITNNTDRNIVAVRVLWTFRNAKGTQRAVWVSTYDRLWYDTFSAQFHIDSVDRLNHVAYHTYDTGSRLAKAVFAPNQRWLAVPALRSFVAKPYVAPPNGPESMTATSMFSSGLLRPPLAVSQIEVKLDCVILDSGEVIGADDEDLAGELAIRSGVASEIVRAVELRLAEGQPESFIASELLRLLRSRTQSGETKKIESSRHLYYMEHIAGELSVLADGSRSAFTSHLSKQLKHLPDIPRFFRAVPTPQ